jgi:hypothetical protein
MTDSVQFETGTVRRPFGFPASDGWRNNYFVRCCLNQFSTGVEAPWKLLTVSSQRPKGRFS